MRASSTSTKGTGEIQRLIIARDILGYSPRELN